MVKFIVVWGVLAVVAAALAGIVAGLKRRDHSFWAAWTFLVPPMLLLLLVMPKNRGPRPRRPRIDVEEEQMTQ